MAQNLQRESVAFAEVVTIDAWHGNFFDGSLKADLHADVVFGTARLGGEKESQVTFRLSVKRAEVVVVVSETEPLSIDKDSVSRDSLTFEGRMARTIEKASQASLKGTASALLSATGLSGSASTEMSAQAGANQNEKLELSASVQLMIVTQSKSKDGHYLWKIESSNAHKVLEGRPWDAVKHPLVKLIDNRKIRSENFPAVVRVEIRCLREDIDILDLRIKNENLWKVVKSRVGFRNRLAAAEGYIRNYLEDNSLYVGGINDRFGAMTLVSTPVEIGE